MCSIYFLSQGGLIFAVSIMVPRATNAALSLDLVLALSAIGMLTRIRSFAAVGSLSIVLFVLCSLWNWTAWANWQGFWIGFWFKSDYPVLVLFAAGYLFLYVRQMRAQAQLQASAERIEELTRLTERRRLARELHDTLAQGLAGVMMQLQAANARLSNGRYERAQEAVQQAITDVRAALAEARFAIDDLRAAEVSAPALPEAVNQTIERFATATGIPCSADLAALSYLPGSVSDHMLMAIREALSNVARHAQARQVWIRAVQHETTVVVEVRDDGIGFDAETITLQPGHYGLLGLRERARLAGGQLDIVTSPGAGTTIRLAVPCRNAGDSPVNRPPIAPVRERVL
jgi:NarL family two-component system sensor histidine kinase YdfH